MIPAQHESKRSCNKASGVEAVTAGQRVKFAQMTRNLKGQGLDEGASARVLVHAAKLIAAGVTPVVACRSAFAQALSDDAAPRVGFP